MTRQLRYGIPGRPESADRAGHSRKRPLSECGIRPYRSMVYSLLVQRDGDGCGICGRSLQGEFEIDHIIPRWLNGTHDARNLRLVHPECHRERTALQFQEATKLAWIRDGYGS